MQWIVTLAPGVEPNRVEAVLDAHRGHRPEGTPPVPMADGETSLIVEGDCALADQLRKIEGVTGVFPSSQMTPY